MDVPNSAGPRVSVPDVPTLPEIRESEAEGRIAILFADIRATQGAGNVNYIWRHLATIPGALEYSWAACREREREIHAFGEKIWSHACAAMAQDPSLRPDTGELPEQVCEVLESYAQGNRWNLAAVSALLGRPLGPSAPPRRAAPDSREAIPPAPRFQELSTELRAIVDSLSCAGPAADTPIRPTLWGHLALFPDVLRALSPAMDAILRSPPFAMAHRSLLELCTTGADLQPSGLNEAAVTSLRFFKHRIAEMTLVGATLAVHHAAEQR